MSCDALADKEDQQKSSEKRGIVGVGYPGWAPDFSGAPGAPGPWLPSPPILPPYPGALGHPELALAKVSNSSFHIDKIRATNYTL